MPNCKNCYIYNNCPQICNREKEEIDDEIYSVEPCFSFESNEV